jgi:hypothetical protein
MIIIVVVCCASFFFFFLLFVLVTTVLYILSLHLLICSPLTRAPRHDRSLSLVDCLGGAPKLSLGTTVVQWYSKPAHREVVNGDWLFLYIYNYML